MWKDHCTKFDAIIAKPPTPPDRTGTSRIHKTHTDEAGIENESIVELSYFCKKVLNSRPHVISLCEHYMISQWISPFANIGFLVVRFPYMFVFRTTTVPVQHTSDIPGNVCNFAMVAKTTGEYPVGFQPNFNDRFLDVDCPSLRNSAVISNILWSTEKLTKP